MSLPFYAQSFDDLVAVCRAAGLTPESASMLFNWHYKKNRREPCTHHNLPRKTREFAASHLRWTLPAVVTARESRDKTVKFLFRLHDGHTVETVLIPFQRKYTVCLSSQVGCAMACSFCYTGEQGLRRHLQAEEIVGQFIEVQRWLTENRPGDDRILNIVYMGQGEPLHNFSAVAKSAEIFLSQHGLSLAGHKITVSTSGYLPGLKRWAQEMPDVNIALSLHSPFDSKREQIIPINRKFPLGEIIPLVDSIPKAEKRFVTYEYLLLEDFNDAAEDAHATGALLSGKKAFVNLIPFNPYPGAKFRRPSDSRVEEFKRILDGYGIPTLVRTTKGDEILAACGQLNTRELQRAGQNSVWHLSRSDSSRAPLEAGH